MKTIPFVLLTTVIGCYGQSGELSKLTAEIKILSEITDGFENKLNQILTENAEKMARAGEEQDKLLTKIKDLEYELEMEREKISCANIITLGMVNL